MALLAGPKPYRIGLVKSENNPSAVLRAQNWDDLVEAISLTLHAITPTDCLG